MAKRQPKAKDISINKLANMDFYHTASENLPDPVETRKRLAKVANQRMRRLEQTNSPISGESYAFGAYDIAEQYLERKGKKRFSESIGKEEDIDMQDVLREITVLQKFIQSKSSSIKGMHEIENKRINTFESKGIHFANTKEFYEFLNSSSFEKLKNARFSSEDIIEKYDETRRKGASPDDIQNAVDTMIANGQNQTEFAYKDMAEVFNAVPIPNSENK